MKRNEENLEGAAGGYILDPGRLYPYKVIEDTTGAALGSKLRHDEAVELAKTLGVSDTDIDKKQYYELFG